MTGKATALAHPNIAFVKYWGQIDEALNLPASPSVSMNLSALSTVTTVEFRPGLSEDLVAIDGRIASGQAYSRVVAHLDRVRSQAGIRDRAFVVSRSNFPAGTGLASSASAFAALSLATTTAAGLHLDLPALSRLARCASGSACRSVPAGYALWCGDTDATSFARQLAGPEHWELRDLVAIVTHQPKSVPSQAGHALAITSPLHRARLAAAEGWLATVVAGIERRELGWMGPAIESDTAAMQAVMMTSQPPLFYWQPATVAVIRAIRAWREGGRCAYFTTDAGPNVHCLCQPADAEELKALLRDVVGVVGVVDCGPGDGVRTVDDHLF